MVELGAEASISDREFWQQAQSELYYQLTHQLRTLWSNGNGTTLNGNNGAGASALRQQNDSPSSW